MRRSPWICLFAALLVLRVGAALAQRTTTVAQTPQRLALVIGNSAYLARPLPTATNDAGLVAETLAREGFDVTAGADADLETMRRLTTSFVEKAKAAGSGTTFVVYVSGYGLQIDGDNYVAPVDARIPRDVDVPGSAYRLADLASKLDAVPARARVYIWDLAHDSPFAKDGAPLASGLAITSVPTNSLVAFNTAPGTVTSANGATYGVYAHALATLLEAPDLPAATLFDQLRLRVAASSDGAAVPWDVSQLDPDFAFNRSGGAGAPDVWTPPGDAITGMAPDAALYATIARDALPAYDGFLAAFRADPAADRVRPMAAARREAMIFAAAMAANMPAAYWTYMRRYPHGPHMFDARRRLALLHAQLEPPPRFDIWSFAGLGVPTSAELALLAKRPAMLRDADATPLPPPPNGILPPSPPDTADLSVPPLPVTGALPLPMPVRLTRTAAIGTIRQPFVPGYGELVSQIRSGDGGAPQIVISRGTTVLSRTVAESEPGKRIVTQRDAKGAVISRSVTTTGSDGVTTVQTGPTGGVLKKVVTRADTNGMQTTTVSNGSNRVIAMVDRDKNGVVIDTRQGNAAARRDATLVFKPGGTTKPVRVEPAETALPKSPTSGDAPRASLPKVEPANPTPAVRPLPPAADPLSHPPAPAELKVESSPPPPPTPPAAPAPDAGRQKDGGTQQPGAPATTPLPPHRLQAQSIGPRRPPTHKGQTFKAPKMARATASVRRSRAGRGAPKRARVSARVKRR